MYMVRETLHCKPGKVRELIDRFKKLTAIMKGMGLPGFRLYSDVSGEPFWTVVAETETEGLDSFVAAENKVMANDEARKVMAGYHDLVEKGFRQIYKVEA